MARTAKLTEQKWTRLTYAEAHRLRILAAHEEVSVAAMIRRLTVEGLRRAVLRKPVDSDEPERASA